MCRTNPGTGCGGSTWPGSIEALLESQPERFGVVTEDPARYRVQIIYTQIDRDEANRPNFRTFRYRVDPDEYFYPASTVKLPTAIVALEKLNDLELHRDLTMLTGEATDFQMAGCTATALVDMVKERAAESAGQRLAGFLQASELPWKGPPINPVYREPS